MSQCLKDYWTVFERLEMMNIFLTLLQERTIFTCYCPYDS